MQENNDLQRITTNGLILEDLTEKERLAVELKYFGKTSQEIADATGYNENYVRNLFMGGGRLEAAYRDFAQMQRTKSQATVDQALTKAREEALGALERIIALSKEACNEAAILKANELLLTIAGISGTHSLRNFLQGKTYEQARKAMNELFEELFGKAFCADSGLVIRWEAPEESELAIKLKAAEERLKQFDLNRDGKE